MTAAATPRVIELAHASPGRLRLRLAWLRGHRDACTGLADHLAARPGVREVVVRPRTGSVLCTYDPARARAEQLIAAVRRQTRVALVRKSGAALDGPPPPRPRGPSRIGRAVADTVRGLDDDIWRATDGNLDLGTLASLAFLGAGALEVAATRRMPMPTWFNLAWWSFRTFAMFESDEEPGE